MEKGNQKDKPEYCLPLTEEELKEVVHSLSFSVIQDRSRNQCFARKGRKLLDKVNEVLRLTEESPFQ
jgi:hypothetical protein